MIDYLNQFWQILGLYVKWIFTLQFAPGVSIGSILLVGSLLFVITVTLWFRK